MLTFQGASGGPREDTVTGLLVRSPQSEWRKGSVIAVDAGTHLSSIVRILQQHMPLYSKDVPPQGYSRVIDEGPFAGIKCPGYSARANALYIFRELMHAFLITHPHLDHLAAMGINTPALEYGREAKTIIALDSTIEAIKAHIFNDSIWPNLSDEGSGVGFVTYRRLKEGGNHRLGQGDARGYVRVCENLATLCMGVSHGKCKSKPTPTTHHRHESAGWHDSYTFPSQRRLSRISDHESYFAAVHSHNHTSPFSHTHGPTTPGYSSLTPNLSAIEADHAFEPVKSSAFFILNEETSAEILIFGDIEPDAVSMSPQNYKIWRTAAPKIANGILRAIFIECSYDDSVRDADLYGHLCPRHLIQELLFLAREVAEYKATKQPANVDVSIQSTETKRPQEAAQSVDSRKRKRLNGSSAGQHDLDELLPPPQNATATPISPSTVTSYVGTRSGGGRRKTSLATSTLVGATSPTSLRPTSPSRIPHPAKHVHFGGPGAAQTASPRLMSQAAMSPSAVIQPIYHASPQSTFIDTSVDAAAERTPDPLDGMAIHIIHVKDTLMDGPSPGDTILAQLNEAARESGLLCKFDITDFGESIWI